MVFLGEFVPESFAEFMRHRAARLSLGRTPARIGTERDRGRWSSGDEPILIDMFEMACSLGPIDCLVLDIYREAERPMTRSDFTPHDRKEEARP